MLAHQQGLYTALMAEQQRSAALQAEVEELRRQQQQHQQLAESIGRHNDECIMTKYAFNADREPFAELSPGAR